MVVLAETITRHPPVETMLSFSCTHPKCKYIAKRRGDLKRHLADIHDEGVIWYTCTRGNCDYATKRKGNLKRHFLLMHCEDDENEKNSFRYEERQAPRMKKQRDVHYSERGDAFFVPKAGPVDGDSRSKMWTDTAFAENKLSSYEKYVFERRMAVMQRDMYTNHQRYYDAHHMSGAARDFADREYQNQSASRREDYLAHWQMAAMYHGMRSPTYSDMESVYPKRMWMDQEMVQQKRGLISAEHGTPIFSCNASVKDRLEEGMDHMYVKSPRLTHRGLETHNKRIAMANSSPTKTTAYRVSKVLSEVTRCIETKVGGNSDSSGESDTPTVTLGSTVGCPVQSNGASRLENNRNNFFASV